MEMNFTIEDFRRLLKNKDCLISEVEIDEFFDEISEKIFEETNVFDIMNETDIFERIAEILVWVPANTLLGLKTAVIQTLLECDSYCFKNLCNKFSLHLVKHHDFYDVNEKNIEYVLSNELASNEDYSAFLEENDTIEDGKRTHFVEYHDEYDDYDEYE